jgi:peptidoglycan hydrolase CwlO-like protein
MIKDKEKEVSDVKETCTQMQAEIDKLNKKIA